MSNFIALDSVPTFYQTYVKLVNQYTIKDALDVSEQRYEALLKRIPEEKGEHRYAEGKWTIKELLVHVLDAERIFGYRALRFSRNDKTNLAGFDEQLYVPESDANVRTIQDISSSMKILRASSKDLFASFTPTMLSRKGTANNTEISVEALGYVIAGHQLHHLSILEERYLIS